MRSILIRQIIKTEEQQKEGLEKLFTGKTLIYTFLNPVSYITALDNTKLFGKFDGIFVDGSILAVAIQLLYYKKITRRSFDMTSIASYFFSYAEKNAKTIYIVASKQEEVERAVEILKKRWRKLRFVGLRNGYFNSKEEKNKEVKHIIETNPDFLIVGMGTLLQEQFLQEVKNAGFKGIGFTCGGFIHQTAKNEITYYPQWVNKMNIRFVYRIYKEPHTRKRYLQAAFLFPIKFIQEKIFGSPLF